MRMRVTNFFRTRHISWRAYDLSNGGFRSFFRAGTLSIDKTSLTDYFFLYNRVYYASTCYYGCTHGIFWNRSSLFYSVYFMGITDQE